MGCILTSGIARDCRDNSGGVRRIALNNSSNIISISPLDGLITSIDSLDYFHEFVVNKQSSNWTETINYGATNSYTQTISMVFGNNTSQMRNIFSILGKSELVAVVEDFNMNLWLVGEVNGLYLSNGGSQSGTILTDLNGWSVSIQGTEKYPARQLDPSFTFEDVIGLTQHPLTPTADEMTDINYTSFIAHWSETENTNGYRIDLSLVEDFSGFMIYDNYDVGNVTQFLLEDLLEETPYYFRVRSYNNYGTSSNSNTIHAHTLPYPIPSTPTALPASDILYTTFTANWVQTTSATDYLLWVYDGSLHYIVSGVSTTDVSSYSVTGATVNTLYYYKLKAKNIYGETSNYSNQMSLQTQSYPIPVEPTALAGTDITHSGFTANWTGNITATDYLLYVYDDYGTYIYSGTSTGNVSSYPVSGLSAIANFHYKLKSKNDYGLYSPFSNIIDVTTSNPYPGIPTATTATNITHTGFTANWDKSFQATNYLLYVWDMSDNPILYEQSTGDVSSYAVSSLTSATTYKYKVIGQNWAGGSDYSNQITATTTDPRPLTPTAQQPTDFNSTYFSANWSSATNATNYRLDIATNSSFTNYVLEDYSVGNVLTYQMTNLDSATTYYYRVRSQNWHSISTSSSIISATTLNYQIVYDCDNNSYRTITIGSQVWLNKDLMTTKYSNCASSLTYTEVGNSVGNANPTAFSSVANNYTYYNRDIIQKELTQCYYQHDVAVKISQQFTGFHLPTEEEWDILIAYVSGSSSKLMSGGTNDYGFNGLKPGIVVMAHGSVDGYGSLQEWWTSTSLPDDQFRSITQSLGDNSSSNGFGYHVRLIADATPATPSATTSSSISITGFTANWTETSSITYTIKNYQLDVSTNSSFTSYLYQNLNVGTSTSYVVSGVTSGLTYYWRVRAVGVNNKVSSNSSTLSLIPQPNIGDYYQGGKVAHIYSIGQVGYVENEVHGIIVATATTNYQNDWWTSSAASLAYSNDGYDDWDLPTRNALAFIYINRVAIGGFAGYNVWTNESVNFFGDYNIKAYTIYFYNGAEESTNKNDTWNCESRFTRYF